MEKELEIEKAESADFEEFEEDFDLVKPDFEVWVFGYDENDQITDFDALLLSSENPDEAVAWATKLVDGEEVDIIEDLANKSIPSNVAYLGIEVEETVNVEGVATNAGSIYYGNIVIKKD